ncbi:hypothetical protein PILCRDRAFT_605706 [Piloderma croceum F 1598]|uniref:Uncharacterized protein n=1 Tax=Piloderma croceum (strain F 1598) TaxID=765440 RepID=A0A0C3FDG4_PILCF|nr:hypothetical protein PILCRDRAFT_605706 [Piloderma croceum F 1598]
MNIPSLFNCRSVRSASINHVNSHAPGSALMTSQLQPFPPPPPLRFRQNVPVGLHRRDTNPPPTHPSGSQMYTPQNPPLYTHRSQTQSMNALGSPFRTPPSRPASTRVYPRILEPQFQLRSVNTQACSNGVTPPTYIPSMEPHSTTSALTSTISRINDNCQSTLVRIRADIEALHVHYQRLILRERAEAARAREIARTMEAERDTARESVVKITEDHRKLTRER